MREDCEIYSTTNASYKKASSGASAALKKNCILINATPLTSAMDHNEDSDSSSDESSAAKSDSNEAGGSKARAAKSTKRPPGEFSGNSAEDSGVDKDDDELSRAALNKMIKERHAPNARVANDARDLVLNCSTASTTAASAAAERFVL